MGRLRPLTLYLALGLGLATLILFLDCARNGFVNYDDDLYVYANPAVNRGLTFDGVVQAFTAPHARNWHPLTTITHMVDCQIFGESPLGPHLVNVLLHALTAASLFLVLSSATGSTWRALIVAILFAWHPLRVESVAWISERKDVLSAILFVATLAVYLRYVRRPTPRALCWVVVVYALALLAKPMVVTLPFVLLLLDYWPLRRFENDGLTVGQSLLEKVPLFVLSVASCLVTIWAAASGPRDMVALEFAQRLNSAALGPWRYLSEIFWPSNFAPLYPYEPVGTELGICAGGALVALTVIFFVLRRRAPALLVGWLWFIGMLIPVLGLVQIGLHSHADRYAYLPSIGLTIALVWTVSAILGRAKPVGAVLAGAAGLFLGWQTFTQIPIWHDSESLWTHTLDVTRQNSVARNNLGAFYEEQGDNAKALAQFQEALLTVDRQPGVGSNLARASIETNIGNVKAKQGDAGGAEEEYRRALRAEPACLSAHVNLANLFASQRDWAGALAEYTIAVQLQPRDADALHRSGVALMRLGQVEEAANRFRDALAVDPRFAIAALDLGNVLLGQGKIDEAGLWYRRAWDADPSGGDASYNLGSVYLQQHRAADAIGAYKHSVEVNRNDPGAHLGLANAYAMAGSEMRAVSEMEEALALAPDSVSVLNNLAFLLSTAKEPGARNPARAVELAEKGGRLAPEPNALIYHTLSAAYASAGRRDEAIAAAEKCHDLAEAHGEEALAEEVSKEIDSLRKAKAP